MHPTVPLSTFRTAASRAPALALSCVLIACFSMTFVGAVGAQQVLDRAKSNQAAGQAGVKPVIPTWAVVCPANVEGALNCYATQTGINPPEAAANLRVNAVLQLSSKTRKPSLLFLLPLGIYLPSGVTIKFGGGEAKVEPIESCQPNGCLVNYPISAAEVAALEKGASVGLTVRAVNNTSYQFVLPGKGFEAAYAKIK